MCVVSSHYQYSFLMFYIILLFSFCGFFLFSSMKDRTKEEKKKETNKQRNKEKIKSRIKFSLCKPFWSDYFFPPNQSRLWFLQLRRQLVFFKGCATNIIRIIMEMPISKNVIYVYLFAKTNISSCSDYLYDPYNFVNHTLTVCTCHRCDFLSFS